MNNTKQEVINLLPWYHLGKLTDEETAQVEKALREDPSLEEAALLEKQIMDSVHADKALMDGSIFDSPTNRLNSVLAKIDQLETPVTVATPKQAEVVAKKHNIFGHIKDYFDNLLSSSSHNFTYAVFAALTVVQLALLVLFIVPSDNINNEEAGGFGLASHTEQSNHSAAAPLTEGQMILLIRAEGHFRAKKFDELLGSNLGATILPDAGNVYKIRINKQLSEREIEELQHELSKKNAKIWIIGEDYSQ